jgi:ABC-2 type transport system permease protein
VRRFAGTGALLCLGLRRDRIIIPLYVAIVAVLVAVTALQSETLYATEAERADYARTVAANPGLVALVGPVHDVMSVGGDVAWQWGGIGAVVAALVSMVLVGRHTRAEEQTGRSELVRAAAVGRFAPLTAALALAAVTNALLGAAVAAGLAVQGLALPGSVALGASLAAVGMVFAGATAVAVQLTLTTSAAYGLVGAVVGGAYVLRAVGDVGDGTASWLSPVGWGQAMRPFAGERWWPLLLLGATAAALVAVAHVLRDRRDEGSGAIAPRPGPPAAGARLATPVGLALRLSRGVLAGWTLGLLLAGVMFGSMARDAGDILGDSQVVRDIYGRAGGTVSDSYLAVSMVVMAQIATASALQVVARARAEERDGRLEALLATALDRRAWAGAYAAVALAGVAVVVLAAGVGAGVADALVAGDAGRIGPMVGAALAAVPATWVVAGVAVALLGLAPRAWAAGWGLLGACVLAAYLGPLLRLPGWLTGLSPFEHLPLVPAEAFDPVPALWLVAVAAALVAAGLAGLRRRDVG